MHIQSTYSGPVARVADELAAIAADGLQRAVVLTPSERLAHAVRVELAAARSKPEHLAGVRFTRPAELARDLLVRSGLARRTGWEPLRHARILRLLQAGALDGELLYFDVKQLRSGQGYADALDAAIHDLEAGGFDPSTLEVAAAALADDRRGAARLRDLARVWAAADAAAGDARTAAQLLAEATQRLSGAADSPPPVAVATQAPGQLSFDDLLQRAPAARGVLNRPRLPPVVALLTATPTRVLLDFLEALPSCRVVFQDARPLRTGTHRWRQRDDWDARCDDVPPGRREVDLVQRFLFELPEHLSDPQRARSSGPDGSVDVEEHAGVDDEVEATAGWIVDRIAAGAAVERVAVIVPDKGSYPSLIRDRLARVQAADGTLGVPVYLAGGVPLAETAAGRRVAVLLVALARGLETEATLRVLPALRRAGQAADAPATRLSPSRAAAISYEAGIAGGGPGDRAGIEQWCRRLQTHRAELTALVAAVETEAAPERGRRMAANAARRWLRDVEPILDAVAALESLARAVADGEPLATFGPALIDFVRRHLLVPLDPVDFVARLDALLAPAVAGAGTESLSAGLALRWIGQRLQRERVGHGRFGEARVFVGTPSQAAGLSFAAVRIVGLAEGGLPRTPHDDPIVPDDLRVRLEEIAGRDGLRVVVPRLADRVLDDLHGVFRAVAGAEQQLALSVPRQWVDRSEREVSGVVLEVATALARTATEAGAGDVPTAGRLRAAYFAVGGGVRRAGSESWPVAARPVLAGVAAHASGSEGKAPALWWRSGALDLGRVHAILAGRSSRGIVADDGAVGAAFQEWFAFGSEERPLSASAVQLLLGCPHRFLLERVLHWREPPPRPSTDAIDPVQYGNLFHQVADEFLREAGAAICRREGSPDDWMRRAHVVAEAAFERLLETLPLRGRHARERERTRFLAQLDRLVGDEWDRPRRTFVASELRFGVPEPIAIATDAGPLRFRGAIDRVDELGDGQWSVRDLKTGRVRDLVEQEVNAARDLQIGLYTLVAEAIAPAGQKVAEAVYVHPSPTQEPERAFRAAQLDGLRARTQRWLTIAAELLANGTFVRTPHADDCRSCPFVAHCGDGAQAQSAAKLAALPEADALSAFTALKREEGGSE